MKHARTVFLFTFTALASPALGYAKPALPASGPKHDSRQPIEVTSDTLEVFQQENKAIFTGHVVAIQGEVRLKSDVMTVYYRKQDDTAKEQKAASAQDSGAIQKIDTSGNVFLSTPEETASGDTGTYDVEHHAIHLNQNVVLTKGQNVLKGDHLTYNFDTQQTVLNSGAGVQATGTAATAGGNKQRVRALFVPGDDKTKKEGK